MQEQQTDSGQDTMQDQGSETQDQGSETQQQQPDSSPDMTQNQGGEGDMGGSGGENWVEPDPMEYGITLGSNSCLDQCWEDFRNCLKNTRFPDQCIATLQACQRACGPQDSGAVPDMSSSPDETETTDQNQ